jgi:hypothetical protein
LNEDIAMATARKRKSSKPGGRKAAKSPVSKAARARPAPKAVPPATGPVTLAEARALVLAKQPKVKVKTKALRKAAVPSASPGTVGAEREKLKQERRKELARRLREYKATMTIMKKRGGRRPQPKAAVKPKRGKPVPHRGGAFTPLQIFAEGDSWFDYPVPFFGGGIIPRLEARLGVPILNLAKAGDEVRYMLGVEERTLLAEMFRIGCPAGGPWDVLLFSGGGNDIVDNPMALWVKDFDPNIPPAALMHPTRFATALQLVRAGYEDLIALRDRLSPTTHLVFQGYDFARPDGRGICHLGPWLKPTFDLRGFPASDMSAAQAVVKAMLEEFAEMLSALTSAPSVKNVTFINGQSTLPPQKSSWHNELHPSRAGFDAFADLFYAKLKALFPNRVV